MTFPTHPATVNSGIEPNPNGQIPHTKGPFWRSVVFQIFIACGVSFTAVGMWNALGSLGAGGAAEPYAVSAANATLYAIFTVVCIFAGVINNRIGFKYGLMIGAVGYPLYAAGLYTNNYTSNTWFLLFGAAICGVSAGFFYAAEASIVIGYPSPHERAFYLAVWATARSLGPIVGGAINLGTNVKRDFSGQISDTTYIIFIVLACLGLPIAACLSSPQKVWRNDGTKVVVVKQESWAKEFKAMFKVLTTPRILMLLPAFFISYFFLGFQSTWYTQYFTVRARALSSFLIFFADIMVSFILAAILDRQSLNLKTRARIGFVLIITVLLASWIWAAILQKKYYNMAEKPSWDWNDKGYLSAFFVSFLMEFGGQGFQQYLYWLIGQYSTNLSSLSHHAGILRSVEAVGQTVAWALQSQKSVSHYVSIGLNLGITVLCIVPAWIVVSELEHPHEIQVTNAQDLDAEGNLQQVKENNLEKQ